jgi:vacuolar-type H+-ATPase subunit H
MAFLIFSNGTFNNINSYYPQKFKHSGGPKLVFQATSKSTSSGPIGADYQDLERVKSMEEKSIKDIQNAESQAERILIDTEKGIQTKRKAAIEDLTKRLELFFNQEEQKAKEEAKKIKADGELESEKLKQDVKARIPDAVKQIVEAVIGIK